MKGTEMSNKNYNYYKWQWEIRKEKKWLVQILKFLQRCCWKFKFSFMFMACLFIGSERVRLFLDLGPKNWATNFSSKRGNHFTSRHGVTFQDARIFRITAVRSNIIKFVCVIAGIKICVQAVNTLIVFVIFKEENVCRKFTYTLWHRLHLPSWR
jgi:hypothetical protein